MAISFKDFASPDSSIASHRWPGQRQLEWRRHHVPRPNRRGLAVRQGNQLAAASAFDLDRHRQGQPAVAGLQDVRLSGLLDTDVAHANASVFWSTGSGRSSSTSRSMPLARRQLGLTQAQLSLAAGVGLRFIVELEAGKPTLRLEHVLRVINALGGELSLSGLSSAPTASIAARPLSDADQPASHTERHQALD